MLKRQLSHRVVVGASILLGGITGCAPSANAIAATAVAQGCWPYGQPRPAATRTPLGSATPTSPTTQAALPTGTPAPHIPLPQCTPMPHLPTLTPTTPPTTTPWTRPTIRPIIDTTTQLLNLSNMPGGDHFAAVAVHPVEGWAAVVWVNWPPDDADHGTVFVKAQHPRTRAWQGGISVSTAPAYRYAAHPAIAVDADGRIHVFWGQLHDGERLHPHYSRSDDGGQSWTDPEPLPIPAGYARDAQGGRIGVDPAGRLHIFWATGTGCDCFTYLHHARPADAPSGTAWQTDTQVFPGTKHLHLAVAFVPLPDGTSRTVAAAGCIAGCGDLGPVVATQDGDAPWQQHTVPGAGDVLPRQQVNWTSVIAFERGSQWHVCLAWGNYARSGNFSSCSPDGGDTWQATRTIIRTDPQGEDASSYTSGYSPELVYEPQADALLAVWLLRQAGDPPARHLAYSYAAVDGDWTPRMDGPWSAHEPPLRLFPATRRNAATDAQVAYAGRGLAVVAWTELERDANAEVYVGAFSPAGLLAEVRP